MPAFDALFFALSHQAAHVNIEAGFLLMFMVMNEPSAAEWKQLREAKGLTQHQAATAAGLSGQSVISNIERGLKPGPKTARRLLEVLKPPTDGPVSDND